MNSLTENEAESREKSILQLLLPSRSPPLNEFANSEMESGQPVVGKETVGTLMYHEPVEVQAIRGPKGKGTQTFSGGLSVSDHEEEVGHQRMEEEKITKIVDDMVGLCGEQGTMLKAEHRRNSYLVSKCNGLSKENVSLVKELQSLKTQYAALLQKYDLLVAERQLEETKLSVLASRWQGWLSTCYQNHQALSSKRFLALSQQSLGDLQLSFEEFKKGSEILEKTREELRVGYSQQQRPPTLETTLVEIKTARKGTKLSSASVFEETVTQEMCILGSSKGEGKEENEAT